MRLSFTLIFAFLYLFSTQASAQKARLTEYAPQNYLKFIENRGQWESQIAYRVEIPSGFLFLKAGAFQYTFYEADKIRPDHATAPTTSTQRVALPDEGIRAHGVEVEFLGSNLQAKMQGSQQHRERYHYYLGNQQAANVPSYQAVSYQDIYPHTQLRIFEQGNQIKYEFELAPKADPKKIRLRYRHASGLRLEAGDLVVSTLLGDIIEKAPYSYQVVEGKRVVVPSEFVLQGEVLSFRFPKGYRKDLPLIIDPSLVFATYSGAVSDHWGYTATFDAQGNLYAGGAVFGADFPATTGVFQLSPGGVGAGLTDIAIMKFNPNGTTLLYAAFLGGSSSESPHSLITDSQNNLLVLGSTSSPNYPTTTGAFDNSFNGGSSLSVVGVSYPNGSDLVISKISADGSQLLASTFVGGSGNDGINDNTDTFFKNYGDDLRGDISVDANDFVYIATLTNSANIAGVSGTLSGSHDGLVLKFNPTLQNLVWGRYLGGSAFDAALSLKVNAAGEVFVAGATRSNNLPLSAATFNAAALGSDDGFVAKYSSDGTLLATTYIGTDNADQLFFLDFDNQGNVFVLGQSFGNYPVVKPAAQAPEIPTYSNTNGRVFVQKLNQNLQSNAQSFSTVIGAGRNTPDISPTAFLINECNQIYIAGWGGVTNRASGRGFSGSSTNNLPLTPDAVQSTTSGNNFYFMVLEEDARGNAPLYATYLGSSNSTVSDHVDGGTSRFSKDGTVYHAVCSCKERALPGAANPPGTVDFPVTAGAYSTVHRSSNCNNAAFKFDFGLNVDFDILEAESNVSVISTGNTCQARIFFDFQASGESTWEWRIFRNGTLLFSETELRDFDYTLEQPGSYEVELVIRSEASCAKERRITKTFEVFLPEFRLEAEPPRICEGDLVTLRALANNTNGTLLYEWLGTAEIASFSDPTQVNNPLVQAAPTQSTTYRMRFRDDQCERIEEVQVEVLPAFAVSFEVQVFRECNTQSSVSIRLPGYNPALRYEYDLGDGTVLLNPGESFSHQYTQAGFYSIRLQVTDEATACNYSLAKTVEIQEGFKDLSNVITPNGDGINDTFKLPEEVTQYKLEIFNRWGTKLFEADPYTNNWGPGVETGIYYYLLTSPAGVFCKGWIQVLR